MNPATGTASLSVPIATTPGRAGFELDLSLGYDSGSGNGPFGVGWHLSTPAITRKTDKGLSRYDDEEDVFILSGAEDLVAVRSDDRGPVRVTRYQPRTEGLFARIERHVDRRTQEVHWRVTTRDNVTNVYGRDPAARIRDPAQPERIFSWLLEETSDDRGNIARYTYKAEDGVGVPRVLAEASRFDAVDGRFIATAQRYLKRIEYGNREPFVAGDWCFEVVFDYGEHDAAEPRPDDDRTSTWPVRDDPFSTYKARFELRMYRLCRRVLVFHRFHELRPGPPPPPGTPPEPTLVRSTDFTYEPSKVLTYLTAVTQAGYLRDGTGYRSATLPPLELDYVRRQLHDELEHLTADSIEDMPNGFDPATARWLDLDGEGLPGLLVTTPSAWFFKRNEGGGRLSASTPLRGLPAPAELGGGAQQLTDVDGDGRLELASYVDPLPGYFSRTAEGGFSTLRLFREVPRIDWDDPDLRLIDLDGDGHADIVLAREEVFIWHRSRGALGFEPARTATPPREGRPGAAVVFSDGTESIQLADMSGDGLLDIVRVRAGEVCYWPNLGWGDWGPKVVMDGAPNLADHGRFDPSRLRLADVDGSGTTDLVYLAGTGAVVFFNQAGNSFSPGERITSLPVEVAPEQVAPVDILGLGTTCLVWTSPLPGQRTASIRYIDLMGGQKPHVLRTVTNNLGARTTITYASSTTSYLADRARGRPWLTRLPFPVQVVQQVLHEDFLARSSLVTRYEYHHGHYDGEEREFAGFARVDQFDEEAFFEDAVPRDPVTDPAQALRLDPVRVTSWFHTGAWLEQTKLETALREQEYGPRDADGRLDPLAPLLPDTPLLASWSVREEKEATRALRGKLLRQETFAVDRGAQADLPYAVTETSYQVKRLVQAGARDHEHGVFLVVPDQTFTAHYERRPTGARVQHELVLDTDDYGNVLESAAVAYGRKLETVPADPEVPGIARANEAQQRTSVSLTRAQYTLPVDDESGHRAPLPCETRVYEITGLEPKAAYFTPADLRGLATRWRTYTEPTSEPAPDQPRPQRRKIEHTRTLFRSDDLATALSLRKNGAQALSYEEYQLALTQAILDDRFKRPDRNGAPPETLVPDPGELLGEDGGYVRRGELVQAGHFPSDAELKLVAPDEERDDDWWVPSGRTFLSPGIALDQPDTPAVELSFARQHFFLPHRFRDPFGAWTHLRYDKHHLLPVETRDALDNLTLAGQRFAGGRVEVLVDYRVLQPLAVSDPNCNQVRFAFDALGMVVGTAVMGKPDGPQEGDSVAGFRPDLATAELAAHLADPFARAADLLAQATNRFVYDVHAFHRTRDTASPQPPTVHTLQRETHVSELGPGQVSRIQVAFTYFDGLGREIQKKIQAEPGPLTRGGPAVSPRWVGSGWVILNNKGKPVRQYEPFFSATHRFEHRRTLGVSATLFYDPVERVVATLHPDQTYEKMTFDPWQQTTWDRNDTVLMDPLADPHVGDRVGKLPAADVRPTWYERRVGPGASPEDKQAALQTARHADTPTIVHFDPLGRPILTVTCNRYQRHGTQVEDRAGTFVDLDIEGFELGVWDAFDREVIRYHYDLRGRRVGTMSMDSGARWTLADVMDQPIAVWDSRGHTIRTSYDKLHRPLRGTLAGQVDRPAPIVFTETEYGEAHPAAEVLNLRGKPLRVRDTAGEVASIGRARGSMRDEAYDFKGNAVIAVRRLATDYKQLPDWSHPSLEVESFVTETRIDALGRPVRTVTPDGSVTLPTYNEANLLERLDVGVRGAALKPFVTNVDYDAKGQRVLIEYGNGVWTTYAYDDRTFRLATMRTRRPKAAWPGDYAAGDERPSGLQYLSYTYDPVGNITRIDDDAQQTIYFAGAAVGAHSIYEYDSLYQLRRAEGREHIGQAGIPHTTWNDEGRVRLPHPHDGQAMRRYTENYHYDKVGNFLELAHRASRNGDWTRTYRYETRSHLAPDLVPGVFNNALSATFLDGAKEHEYPHDEHGNMLSMAHLPSSPSRAGMVWDAFGRLASSTRQRVTNGGTPEIAYYVYDGAGERMCKLTETYADAGSAASRMHERIYLRASEVYREFQGNGSHLALERETLHVHDGNKRIAMVDTMVKGITSLPRMLPRYQIGTHLGSVYIELGGSAEIISIEEYHPYGSTAYSSTENTEAPKRYRYTSKEKDEGTGLSYHSARYYIPWLGRWSAVDPAVFAGNPLFPYSYARSAPTRYLDDTGAAEEPKLPHYERPGRQWYGYFLGNTAHVLIAAVYEQRRPYAHSGAGKGIYTNYYTIATVFDAIGVSQEARRGLTLRSLNSKPDIANTIDSDVLQIKPGLDRNDQAAWARIGRRENEADIAALNYGVERQWVMPGKLFAPGAEMPGSQWFSVTGGRIYRLSWKTTEDGIIQYALKVATADDARNKQQDGNQSADVPAQELEGGTVALQHVAQAELDLFGAEIEFRMFMEALRVGAGQDSPEKDRIDQGQMSLQMFLVPLPDAQTQQTPIVPMVSGGGAKLPPRGAQIIPFPRRTAPAVPARAVGR